MNIQEQIAVLEGKISLLPVGYISKKTINGKVRYYHQWTENKKLKSKYIKDGEYNELKAQIELRKKLQNQLKELKKQIPEMPDDFSDYSCNVLTGKMLVELAEGVKHFDRRDCYGDLQNFLKDENTEKICIVYGLRRTGKTTMLRQAVYDMSFESAKKAAYIKITTKDDLAKVNHDMKLLKANGYKYVFIDETTLMNDFIDGAALFSDVYAATGMKIVLSGTDSLGFWIALQEELYDRAKMIHTTFIPFREYARLLEIGSVDEYIRYGGTLKMGELRFDSKTLNDNEASFRDDETTRIYIDTAISKNIQNSLSFAERGGHFRNLKELYYAGELTGAINRIIEDMNHEFVKEVLTRDFVSGDFGISASNLRKQKDEGKRTDILDTVDRKNITSQLMEILNIRNRSDQTVKINCAHASEIKEYLKILDLIYTYTPESTGGAMKEQALFTQPGMRYCQAQALVHSLMNDKIFSTVSEYEKKNVIERILEKVRGRMMEDIILLETAKALPDRYKVFKMNFPVGEFDMVIYDKEKNNCKVYEIKHSRERTDYQYRHLIDNEKCSECEMRFGKIIERAVIYRGEITETDNGIKYLNAEGYLKNLDEPDLDV